MGSWFSNVHIRKGGAVTVDAVAQVELTHYDDSLPCLVGYESVQGAVNLGAAGTGLKIWLLIDGAQREEVTYDPVYLRYGGQDCQEQHGLQIV